jgi:CheY-like chemotaxis protein
VTPRQSDVAFVLEGVPGVLGVFALSPSAGEFEFAVKLERGGESLAGAHYALLRVLTHEECKRVLFFETELPSGLRAKANAVVLSPSEIESSRRRVPERSPALDQPPALWLPRGASWATLPSAPFAALVVGTDPEIHHAVIEALGVGARRVLVHDPVVALNHARVEAFDLIICSADVAFGSNGFLDRLRREDAFLASRVVLVAKPEKRDVTIALAEEMGSFNTCLTKPLDPSLLLEIARTGGVVLPWNIPVPPARPERDALGSSRRRVLVVDEDPKTQALSDEAGAEGIEIVVTHDPWRALDELRAGPPDAVLCSATMRVGSTPMYRFLWASHPELKSRFVLIVAAEGPPRSVKPGQEQLLLTRPLTRETITALLRSKV